MIQVNYDNVINRLYVYGKNKLSIENFSTDKFHTYGNKYIEIENITIEDYKIKEAVFEDGECEDFHQLYIRAIEYLVANSKPEIRIN